MKQTLFFFIAFFVIVSPVFGELTPQDLDKIRLILKEEIAASEARLRAEIAASEARLRAEIFKSETQMKNYVDVKFEGVNDRFKEFDKRVTLVVGFVSGLIILIVVTIGIPQIIMAWRGGREREQNKKIEELAQEIEELKRKLVITP